MRLAPLMIFALCVAVFAVVLFRKDTPSLELIDRPLPAFTLTALGGENASLSTQELSEGTVLLNVFASWCVSCVAEHPVLMKAQRALGVPIYGLAWKDSPADTYTWLAEHGNPYTQIGVDREGRAAMELGVTGAPETFLIHHGHVRYRYPGPLMDEDIEETLPQLLRKLEEE